MKNQDLNLSSLTKQLSGTLRKVAGYKGFIFFLVAAMLYGFITWRINVYSSVPPDQNEVSSQTAAQPHIDKETIQKLQSLQDNSVSVQSLFDQARDNPFQE